MNTSGKSIRLAVLASHPIQYQSPLFRVLATQLELKVFYCWDPKTNNGLDPEFGRRVAWDVPLLDGFDFEFVPNWSTSPGTGQFGGIFNPSMPRQIARWQADAVLIQGYSHMTYQLTAIAMKTFGRALIFRGESNLLSPRTPAKELLKSISVRPFLQLFDAFCAIGTANREYLFNYGVPPERVFLSPYSVDNEFFRAAADQERAKRSATRKDSGIPPDATVFLFVGKLIAKKGCADLVEAFLEQELPRAHLVIVGDGPERSALERRGVGRHNIHFVGFKNQSELPRWYASADVFVIPSLFEPWGLVVNEAMNYRLPVICSDQVGSSFDLVDSANGWSYPAGNRTELGKALRLASSSENLATMGEESLQRVSGWGLVETARGIRSATEFALRLR